MPGVRSSESFVKWLMERGRAPGDGIVVFNNSSSRGVICECPNNSSSSGSDL